MCKWVSNSILGQEFWKRFEEMECSLFIWMSCWVLWCQITCSDHNSHFTYTHGLTHFSCYRGIIPHAVLFLRRLPIIGHFLNMPGVRIVRHSIFLKLVFCSCSIFITHNALLPKNFISLFTHSFTNSFTSTHSLTHSLQLIHLLILLTYPPAHSHTLSPAPTSLWYIIFLGASWSSTYW